MATAALLYVGDDFFHRIPVMEKAGLAVVSSEDSISTIQTALGNGIAFSAITFHCDFFLIPPEIVQTARTHSASPLVLFSNPLLNCDESEFDLVIPAMTPPTLWIQKLRELIQASILLRERSVQLRQDCLETRFHSEALRLESGRLCQHPIDADALWLED